MYEYVGPDHWERITVFDLARWKNGLAFKSINFSETGRPVIKIAELKSGITDQTKFTDSDYDESVFVRRGDMLFSWSGNPDTSIDVFRWEGPEGWLNQHIYKVTPSEGVDEDFLFFVLRWLKPRFAEIARNKQTTGLGHVTLRDFKSMAVGLPDEIEQKAIVSIVGPIQEKIDLNRHTNETLEALARAIFKDWFVDFGPTRAKVEGREPYLAPQLWDLFPDALDDEDKPVGWDTEPIYDQAEWVNGAAYKNMHFSDAPDALPVVKIAELKAGVTDRTQFTNTHLGEKYRINSGELLFSWSGNPDTSIDAFIWQYGPAWLNQHIFSVRDIGKMSKPQLYFMLKTYMPEFAEIARNKQTTGLGHVTKADMQRMIICTGSSAVRDRFDDLIKPIFDKLVANLFESRELATSRDLLLPKLISGEIRLREAEKLVEKVA